MSVGSLGRLLLLAYMCGCLTICETFLPCPPSGWLSHFFPCPLMIGLIVVLLPFLGGVVSMVLVLWELVLFYGMGMEFKGEIFLNYSRRVKWQQGATAGIGLSVYNVFDWPLYIITLVQWCGGWQGKVVVQWLGIVPQSGSVGLGFSVEILWTFCWKPMWGDAEAESLIL